MKWFRKRPKKLAENFLRRIIREEIAAYDQRRASIMRGILRTDESADEAHATPSRNPLDGIRISKFDLLPGGVADKRIPPTG